MADPNYSGQTYSGPDVTVPSKPSSLMEDAGNVHGRLSSLLGQMQNISYKLNGGQPRAIEDTTKVPEQPNSIRRLIDLSRALLGKIEDEVQAIDARL